MKRNIFILYFLLQLFGCNKDTINWFPGTLDEAISQNINSNKNVEWYHYYIHTPNNAVCEIFQLAYRNQGCARDVPGCTIYIIKI